MDGPSVDALSPRYGERCRIEVIAGLWFVSWRSAEIVILMRVERHPGGAQRIEESLVATQQRNRPAFVLCELEHGSMRSPPIELLILTDGTRRVTGQLGRCDEEEMTVLLPSGSHRLVLIAPEVRPCAIEPVDSLPRLSQHEVTHADRVLAFCFAGTDRIYSQDLAEL